MLKWTKYLLLAWVVSFLNLMYGAIPALNEFMHSPLLDNSVYPVTVFTMFSAFVFAILSAYSKDNLQKFSYFMSQNFVLSIVALSIILIGFLAAGDLLFAYATETDPFVLELLFNFIRDPSLDTLINETLIE
jgi:hypothetical protein